MKRRGLAICPEIRSLSVLVGKERFFHINTPVDRQFRIIESHTALMSRRIEIVAFIGKNRRFAQYAETMTEPARYQQLPVIVFGQLDRNMLAVCR